MLKLLIILMISSPTYVTCWDSKELQMFDLVEDLKNENFYDFLNVKQNASSAEIRRAYRRMSLKYHPDKNEGDPKADEKFKQLVGVYEVLRDEKLRERYNDVLANGLPTWRQPVFYYRQLRKMGLMETVLLVFLILTVGHYFVLWGSYLEKKLNMESYLSTIYKKNKARRKQKDAVDNAIQEELSTLPRPRLIEVWPIAMTLGTYRFIRDLPKLCVEIKEQLCRMIKEMRDEKNKLEAEKEERKKELEEREKKKELKKKRKAEKAERTRAERASNASVTGDDPVVYNSHITFDLPDSEDAVEMKEGPWSDEELVHLTQLVNSVQQGVPDRWQRIAKKIGRPVQEVTKKVNEMRSGGGMPMASSVQHTLSGISADVLTGRVGGGITVREPAFEVVENAVCGTSSEEEDEYESARHRRQARRRKKRQPERRPEVQEDEEELTEALPTEKKTCEPIPEEKAEPPSVSFPDSVFTWSQDEQRTLEAAIRKFPKGIHERWDRISDHVSSRSKVECMDRFRYLTERLKSKCK